MIFIWIVSKLPVWKQTGFTIEFTNI